MRVPHRGRWLVLAALGLLLSCGAADSGPIRVGVLLPLSGPDINNWEEPLTWAAENVNRAGGIGGRRLELVFRDIAVEDLTVAAKALAADSSVRAVIGPDASRRLFEVAPLFLKAQKPIVSPSATSADIFRAFSGQKFVWRTVESDIAQLRAMFVIAARRGVRKVGLVTGTDHYGSTFFDWFGFFATELGMQVSEVVQYDEVRDPACAPYVALATAGQPDVLFVVPSTPEAAVCIAREAAARPGSPKLLFSDYAQLPYVTATLGLAAEGLEGTGLAPDPRSGFETAYAAHYGKAPLQYAANAYDALLLIAYGLARSGGAGGTRLADAMTEVVDARGTPVGWDKAGVATALRAIESGTLPDISGATGPLDFDREFHTDLTSSTYAHWRVENRAFVNIEYLPTTESGADSSFSAFRTLASQAQAQALDSESSYRPGARTGLWALLVATSRGFENYRHQADMLAQYRLLRSRGVPAERIVLVAAGDLAGAPENPDPGAVRNAVGGPNLAEGVTIDYRLDDVTPADLLDILAGRRSSRLPKVVASTAGDNVYVFLVGHGDRHGLSVQGTAAQGTYIKPDDLSRTLGEMFTAGKYRRVLVAVEACFGGSLGVPLTAPGALLLSSANPYENSVAVNYDARTGVWLADQFSFGLSQLLASAPQSTLRDAYEALYLHVNGSHVSVYNNASFGSVDEVTLDEFLRP